MHPGLGEGLERLARILHDDDRCLGVFLWGSQATGDADAYADLDVGVVVVDDRYDAVDAALPGICQCAFGPIVSWLPEGRTGGFVNYAFLAQSGEDLILCDLLLTAAGRLQTSPVHGPRRMLFDKAGLLQSMPLPERAARSPLSSDGLRVSLCDYWTYMYLNGKYFRRGDIHKLLYVQEALFHRHVAVLRYACPELPMTGWSAKDVSLLAPADRERLLIYHSGARLHTIGTLLQVEMARFSEDARKASARWGVAYPEDLELAVRGHLTQMGLEPAATSD